MTYTPKPSTGDQEGVARLWLAVWKAQEIHKIKLAAKRAKRQVSAMLPARQEPDQ